MPRMLRGDPLLLGFPLADFMDTSRRLVRAAIDAKDHVFLNGPVAAGTVHHAQEFPADLFDCLLRALVVLADHENDTLHKAKCVVKHKAFHLSVVLTAPVLALQEGEADLDLALFRLEIMVAGAADDVSGLAIDGNEGTAGFDAAVEITLKDRASVAVRLRVLLPDERVGGSGKERIEVLGLDRT